MCFVYTKGNIISVSVFKNIKCVYMKYKYDFSYRYYCYDYYYVVIETTHSGIVYGMRSSHKYFGHNWCRILQLLTRL